MRPAVAVAGKVPVSLVEIAEETPAPCREVDRAASERLVDTAIGSAGTAVARTRRLCVSALRLGFERGDLGVGQLRLARPDGDDPARQPLRPWW